jgi:hypothetical protein
MNRRRFVSMLALLGVGGGAAGGAVYAVEEAKVNEARGRTSQLEEEMGKLQAEKARLDERIGRLAQRWVASGGGTNVKQMPGPSGQPVELREIFSFDRNHAYCRVDVNPQAFVMPTHNMGEVLIPANGFFMSMSSSSIDRFDVQQRPDGKAAATLRGFLGCHTEVVTATVKLGSRTVSEPAAYEIVAVDGGIGSSPKEDSFAFTVWFDETTASLNHAIFGAKFTFTGEMVEGKITIQNLARLVP